MPLDILYEMPPSIKPVLVNQWVWETREHLDSAHTFVRQYTGESIKRQKHYHDMKLSYEIFEPGDGVYVFFPVRKVGCSSKFTSFWRGPYQIIQRLSEVLYKVNCGRSGEEQIIHCDRLMKAKKQVLTGENQDNETISENELSSENEDADEAQVSTDEGVQKTNKEKTCLD